VDVLVDLEPTAFTSLDYFVPSPDGRYLAYGASSDGTEESILHVIDTRSKAIVLAPIDRARDAEVAWMPGETQALVYSRQHPRIGSGPLPEGMKKVFLRPLAPNDPETALFGYEVGARAFVKQRGRSFGRRGRQSFCRGRDRSRGRRRDAARGEARADLSNAKKHGAIAVPTAAGVIAWALRGRDLFTIEYAGAPRHRLLRHTLNDDGSELHGKRRDAGSTRHVTASFGDSRDREERSFCSGGSLACEARIRRRSACGAAADAAAPLRTRW